MYPAGYTDAVQSAPFSYSGSSGVTQQNSCVLEFLLHSPCSYPCVRRKGEHCFLCCLTEADFPSLVWDLGHRFLGKGQNDSACLSSANCQVPSLHQARRWELVRRLTQHHCSTGSSCARVPASALPASLHGDQR